MFSFSFPPSPIVSAERWTSPITLLKMGNSASATGYSRLNRRSSPLSKPLLGHDYEGLEQQMQLEVEAYREKNASLEKEIEEMKKKSMLEARIEANICNSPHHPPSKALMPQLKKDKKADTVLEKEVNDLKIRVAKLETLCPMYSWMKKQEEDIKAIKKTEAQLEKKVLELSTNIDEMKRSPTFANTMKPAKPEVNDARTNAITLMDLDPISDSAGGAVRNAAAASSFKNPISNIVPANDVVNDLIGCLVVLIFLVAVLIALLV